MDKIVQTFEDLKAKILPEQKTGSKSSRTKKTKETTSPVVAPNNNASQSQSIGNQSGNMKALHQLWYLEEDFTFVPMACYRSKQAPETAHVLSERDDDGSCVWCIPLGKRHAVNAVPPVHARDVTPVAGGLGYQLNLDQQRKRPLRRLISTGITMGVGAGVLKAVQVVNEKGGLRGFITVSEDKQQ